MRSYSSTYRVHRGVQPLLEQLEGRVVLSFVAPLAFDARLAISVNAADMNGDGQLDLVTPGTVLLGNGDGTFRAGRDFTTGVAPISVAVGDVNGDGFLDVAQANQGDVYGTGSSVRVLLGNGTGSFPSVRTFNAGISPKSVAMGDLNGDGFLDLILAGYNCFRDCGHESVRVLLGNGDGTFQNPQHFSAGNFPRFVTVGEFNGDGFLDLAVANGVGFGDVGSLSVLLGNGDGSFQAARYFGAGRGPISVAVGDVNGDGLHDLAVANFFSDNVSVLLGNGDGSFQPARSLTARGTNFVAVGEFNGDAFPDLVTTGSVLLGNGDGTFQAARNIPAGVNAVCVVVGDVNGDLFLDLAVAGSSTVGVLLGTGDGSFQTARQYNAGNRPSAAMSADVNSDGFLDLVVANESSDNVSVLLGNGDGTFQPGRDFLSGVAPNSVAVGDMNGDGVLDLAVANSGLGDNTVSVFLGNGDGTFQKARHFNAGAMPRSVMLGDVNGDSFLDLAVTDYYRAGVLLGNGDGTFQAFRSFLAGSQPRSVALGDLNGDGFLDLAVASSGSNTVSVLLGNGDGSFQMARNFTAGGSPSSVALGDLNDDGFLDLALASEGNNTVSVLFGNGDGSFQAARYYQVGRTSRSVAVRDVNGDEILDLVVTSGTVRVLLGNGDGTFQANHVSYVAGAAPVSVSIADFNGDGWPDLAVANSGSNDVSVLDNDTNWGRSPGGVPGPGGDSSSLPGSGIASLLPSSVMLRTPLSFFSIPLIATSPSARPLDSVDWLSLAGGSKAQGCTLPAPPLTKGVAVRLDSLFSRLLFE